MLPAKAAGRVISIHAPREGGDDDVVFYVMPEDTISIHAPREGGDNQSFPLVGVGVGFQSTPPARGATTPINIYKLDILISIHAPREGGDCCGHGAR